MTDARGLLDSLGHTSMDLMSPDSLRTFQRQYLARKLELEKGKDHYFTDRSFVDVAAYWIVRDSAGLSTEECETVIEQCRLAAARYDLHVYFPFGVISFKSDGYRSEDYEGHRKIDDCIQGLLEKWSISFLRLVGDDLQARAETVLEALLRRDQ